MTLNCARVQEAVEGNGEFFRTIFSMERISIVQDFIDRGNALATNMALSMSEEDVRQLALLSYYKPGRIAPALWTRLGMHAHWSARNTPKLHLSDVRIDAHRLYLTPRSAMWCCSARGLEAVGGAGRNVLAHRSLRTAPPV